MMFTDGKSELLMKKRQPLGTDIIHDVHRGLHLPLPLLGDVLVSTSWQCSQKALTWFRLVAKSLTTSYLLSVWG